MKRTSYSRFLARAAVTLLAVFSFLGARAQEIVTIGEETGTTYYFPIDNYFNYSCTQQIYTAEEIGIAGTIEAVSFYYNYGTAYTASNVTMYMKNVERSDFSSTTDCEALAPGDIVWTGSIAPTEAGWYTFTLDTPFEYDGTSNLLVAFFDGTSGYPGTSYTWRQTTSPNSAYMALRYYSDSNCPDPYNLSSYDGSKQWYNYRSNIQIVIEPAASDCPKPTGLAVSEVGAKTAVLNWTENGEATAWEICLNDDEENLINADSNPFTLTGLTPETAYTAKVRACYDADAKSNWSSNISFTTLELYAKPTGLAVSEVGAKTAVLNWTENGEATAWEICLNDDEENLITADSNPFTLTGLTPETAYTAKVRACYDADAKSNWSSKVNFFTLVACPKPTNLSVTNVTHNSATISWTGSGDAYDLRYAVMPEGIDNAYLQYSTEEFSGGVGTGGGAVYWGIRFPAADLAAYDGQTLTQVGVFTDSDGDYGWTYSGNYTVRVYQGGDTAPGTLVSEATEYLPGDFAWHDITLTTPVEIDATQDLWLTFYTPDIAYPMSGCTYVGNADSDFLSLDGSTWEHATGYGLNYTWMIRGFVELSEFEWVDIFDLNTNSCQIAPLTPNTTYIVKVRSSYSEDGKSKWVTTAFTTNSEMELVNDDSGNEEGEKNSDIITANIGKACDVTLTGRTLYKDGLWNTICLPFDVVDRDNTDELTFTGTPLAGAIVRTLASASTSPSESFGTHIDLVFEEVTALEAGKPYIIRWNAANENIVDPVFENVLIEDVPESDRTISMANGNVKFIGYYDAFGINETNEDIFYMKTGKDKNENDITTLVRTNSERILKSCRAYFQFSEYDVAKLKFTIDFGDGSTTGIVDLDREATTNSGWYTVDGKKLDKQPTRKGVYIQNGVKVVIK